MVLREGNPDLTDKEVPLESSNGFRGRKVHAQLDCLIKKRNTNTNIQIETFSEKFRIFWRKNKSNFVAVGGPFSGD